MSETLSEDEIEAGRRLFAAPISFLKGVVGLDSLPPADRPEVAFAGRSNVGKSSLINALANRKQLARASNTPGRTQEINYFELSGGRLFLVDLPGYGFAEAPKKAVDAWSRFTMSYLRGRAGLKRVFLLIDSRRGVGEVDLRVMKQLDKAAVAYQIVLTKTDKLKALEAAAIVETVGRTLTAHPAAHPHVIATSSEKGVGLAELRAEIFKLSL